MNLDRMIAVRNNKTIYRDGGKCIKIFHTGYSRADILREALNQTVIEEAGLSVPRVYEVTTFNGKWAIVSEYIKGKTLDRLISEDFRKKSEYINMLVDLQLQVHSKTCPLLERMQDKICREIGASRLGSNTRSYLLSSVRAMQTEQRACHGDFAPTNIIISEKGVPYILDWAVATHGDTSLDGARTYLLFWMNGDIDGAEKYIELFCKKSGKEVNQVKSWMPVVAASQLRRSNEKQREFLYSWIDGAN